MKFEIEENRELEKDIECVGAGKADLLKYNEDLVGACIKHDKNNPFEIGFIAIKKETRTNGLGTVFVKMYEVMAKERGFSRMIAKVEESKHKAINFWEKKVNWTKNRLVGGQWIFYKDL